MKIIESIEALRSDQRNLKPPVGLVPTMGYLHPGHLSLVDHAHQECGSVVVSIYVNPAQFGINEDLNAYPRDLQRDYDLLRSASVDVVWVPSNQVMYPPGYQTWITVEEITKPLEGALRPGHFRGVATVVTKLFNVVQPDKAYFGQKDAQQVAVIRRMVMDLNFPIDIIVCPTVREPDGLAMSSRNVYLNPAERQAAVILSQALFRGQAAFSAGERSADSLRKVMLDTLKTEPMVQVQYVSCADPDTLREIEAKADRALLSLSARIGATHLIDNIVVG